MNPAIDKSRISATATFWFWGVGRQSMTMTYYIRIDGVAGDSTDKSRAGWFELPSFSLGESNDGSIGSSGKATFTDLSILLLQNTTLADLFARLALGSNIAAVEIEGVDSTANGEQVVFDLTLNDVSVGSVSSSASFGAEPSTSAALSFGKIGLVTTSYDSKGSISDVQSFGWDLALKTAIDPASLNTPNSPSIGAVPDPVTYFLRIDGVAGDSTVKGYEGWFEVPSFSFDGSLPSNLGGGGVLKAQFGDVSLFLASETVLAKLLASTATGAFISAIEIAGVTTSGGAPKLVYDLTLNDVQVTSAQLAGMAVSGGTNASASFRYGKIGLVTTSVDPAGGPDVELSFGWDVTQNVAIDPATLVAPASAPVDSVPEPVTYYLKIDGIAGDSTVKGFEGWIEIPSFFFGASNASGPSGRPNFSDLTLTIDDATALAPLFALGASGKQAQALEIVGVSGGVSPEIVYDLKLNGVSVTSVSQNESAGALAGNIFSFAYDKIGLVTTSVDPNGNLGPRQTFGWDLKNVTAIDPFTLVAPTNSTINDSPEPVVYYLRIDGVAGDATTKGYEGWFELPQFSIGEANSSGLFGGGVNFQNLSLTLESSAALTALMARVADGKFISAIEIEGLTGGKTPLKVYDLTLNDVSVASVTDDATNTGAATSVELAFGKIGIITTNVDVNGAATGQQGFGWDVINDVSIDPSKLVTATSVTGDVVPTDLTYYLRIDGVAGDSTDPNFKGWFELSSFNLAGFNSGGQTVFGDLSLTLDSETAIAALMALGVTGKQVLALEIEGVANGAKGAQVVYELTLNNLVVSSVQEGADAAGTTGSASFNYAQVGIVTTGFNPDGTTGDRLEFGWDLLNKIAIDPDTLAQASSAAVNPVPQPTTYYLKIDGIEGDSTNPNYKGWFEIGKFNFGETNPVLAGGGATVPSFQDLFVSLPSEALLAAALAASTSGKTILALEIEGVVDNKGNPLVVYDLTLNDLLVSSVNLGGAAGAGSGGTRTTFDFGKIGLVTTSIDANGAPSTQQEFGWDVLNRVAIDPATLISPDTDTIAPNVTIDSQALVNDTGVAPNDLITSDGHVDLAGTASDNRILTSVHIFDGLTDLGAATLSGSNWTFSFNLADGVHSLFAVATDAKGNTTSTSLQPPITVDKTAPGAAVSSQQLVNDTGSSSIDRVTSDGRVTLAGTASDGVALASLHIFDGVVDLGAATLNGTDWSFDVTLAEGTHSLVAVATDAAGNTFTTGAQPQIVVDATGPQVAVVSQTLINDTGVSPTDLVTTDGRVVLTGTASDGVALASVHIFDGSTDLGAATINGADWSFNYTLPVGVHALTAVATDTAGNSTMTATQPQITVLASDPIVGQPGQKIVNGTDGDDLIVFGTTNQIVNANGGDDVIALAAGSTSARHTLNGAEGVDTLDLSATTTSNTVNLINGKATGAELGRSILNSIENVIGGAAGDVITANGSVNEFTGGGGADRFEFRTLGAARNGDILDPSLLDTIIDFESAADVGAGHDVIDLRGIDAIQGGRNNAFTFVSTPWDGQGSQFTGAGQISYEYGVDAQGREVTIISGNVDAANQGNGLEADFQIVLLGHIQLSASDFLL